MRLNMHSLKSAFSFKRVSIQQSKCTRSRFYVLFTGFLNLFFNKIFIANGFYVTIYIFKNYFILVFSVFSNISLIQTDTKS